MPGKLVKARVIDLRLEENKATALLRYVGWPKTPYNLFYVKPLGKDLTREWLELRFIS